MRIEVRDAAALELWEAVEGELGVIGEECIDRVKSFLSDGVDPNARFGGLESAFSGVAEDWAGDARTAPPLFQFDPTELTPLRRAAGDGDCADGLTNKSETARLMTILLQHGADPYAVYRQPVLKHRYFDLCPGKRRDERVIDEECKSNEIQRARNGIIQKALRLGRKRRHIEQGVYDPGLDEYKRDDEADLDDWIESLDLPTRYRVHCVIHTLLRNGMLVQPIFDFLGDALDVERRAPRGRTLFLAACRSRVGPDASTDGVYGGLGKIPYDSGICETPYPQPDNAWKDFESKNSKACTGPTFL